MDGTASWNDTLTIGGSVVGAPVTLLAEIGIDVQFVGLGFGHASVNGCFTSPVFAQVCTFGGDGADGPLILPVAGTRQFTAHVGDTFALQGDVSGGADVDNLAVSPPGTSGWSLLATNSAHFKITSLTPGVDLTLASGCSITNGLGCDSPAQSPTPEPSSLLLVGTGLLFVARIFRSIASAPSAPAVLNSPAR